MRGWVFGVRTARPASWWSPRTRPPCPRRPPGIWPPTCPGPAGRGRPTVPTPRPTRAAVVAEGAPRRSGLAFPVDRATTLLAVLVGRAPAARTPSPDQRGRRRAGAEPLPPALTNHR